MDRIKVDSTLRGIALDGIGRQAARLEQVGQDGVWTAEAEHDAFLPIPAAAASTSRLTLGTGVAIAFSRSPMTLAYLASDLQSLSRGRFVLGLGSQIKPHIERRYSMPWSRPAARMGEMVAALRAIWRAWETGERLAFEGDFYRHTLMTPEFSPEPPPSGWPPVFVAAVGPRMTETAAAVADGVFLHGFTTMRYLTEVTLPSVDKGLARAGRLRSAVQLVLSPFLVTAGSEEGMVAAREAARRRVAFYGSTPAYRPVLDLEGWGDLADELHAVSVEKSADRWERLADLVDDEVLDAFVFAGPLDSVGELTGARLDGLVDRVRLPRLDLTDDQLSRLVENLKSSRGRGGG